MSKPFDAVAKTMFELGAKDWVEFLMKRTARQMKSSTTYQVILREGRKEQKNHYYSNLIDKLEAVETWDELLKSASHYLQPANAPSFAKA